MSLQILRNAGEVEKVVKDLGIQLKQSPRELLLGADANEDEVNSLSFLFKDPSAAHLLLVALKIFICPVERASVVWAFIEAIYSVTHFAIQL